MAFGLGIRNYFRAISFLFDGKLDHLELIGQASKLAMSTLPTVFVTTFSLGVVLAVQVGPEFVSNGMGNNIGVMTAVAMAREIAPIIGALMIATQYGAGTAAEIANMKVTEQVDALKVMKVDPVEYLVLPRFIAAIFLSPFVVFLGGVVGVLSTYFSSYLKFGLSFAGFMNSIWAYMNIQDIYLCLFKASVFGGVIILISTTIGLMTRGGAKDVVNATTSAVVWSFILVIIVDYLITALYL